MKKIDSIQYCSILFMILVGTCFGIEGMAFFKISPENSWLYIISMLILELPIFYVFIKIFSFKPNLAINDKIKVLFNNKTSCLINILLLLFYFIMLIIKFYDLNYFIISQFLTKTPTYIIGISFALIVIYINSKNINIISRVNLLLTFLSTILFFISTISLIKSIDFNNFLPILKDGIIDLKNGTLNILLINISPLFLFLIIPKNQISKNSKINKFILLAFFISIIFEFIIIGITIGILGTELCNIYQYPEYIVLKRVTLFNFIDKIENLLTIQWIFGIFMYLSLNVYYIKQTITKKDNNFLITIITLLALFFSLLIFKNNTIYENFIIKILPIIRLFLLIILFIIFIKILLYEHNYNNTQNNNN